MSLPVYVDSYSGYKANERPRQFELDDEIYEIAAVEDQWYSPEAMFFKVRTIDGKCFILRYDDRADEWTLQSGLTATNCWPGLASNSLRSMRRRSGKRKLRSNPANTAIQTTPKSPSTGF